MGGYMPKIRKTTKSVIDFKPLFINIHDYRMALGVGMVLGMLIVGLPQLLGVGILLSILIMTLKLVDKDRL